MARIIVHLVVVYQRSHTFTHFHNKISLQGNINTVPGINKNMVMTSSLNNSIFTKNSASYSISSYIAAVELSIRSAKQMLIDLWFEGCTVKLLKLLSRPKHMCFK